MVSFTLSSFDGNEYENVFDISKVYNADNGDEVYGKYSVTINTFDGGYSNHLVDRQELIQLICNEKSISTLLSKIGI